MTANFNIGLLGHVDSGKTSLARALSSISSTAAFDKNPQSQQRGITIDLGFSALVVDAPKDLLPQVEKLQFTFVDCPGHASLLRTIIGGAQIIDLVLLVVDAQKGIQTQTAESLIIAEILQKQLILVINKIDSLPSKQSESQLDRLCSRLRRTLSDTSFGNQVPMYCVSALKGINIAQLRDGIAKEYYLPKRQLDTPLLMYVDHCFSIKGQGTVCTGTLIQGCISVNDVVELPALAVVRKVKSIQMFKQPVQTAVMGDRIGLGVTQFNAKLLERGIISKPGYLKPIYAACMQLQSIRYYKQLIKSKSKFHISLGHDTVIATIILCSQEHASDATPTFDSTREYEYMEFLDPSVPMSKTIYVLLQFDTPVLTTVRTTLIASKLDMDIHSNSCRLAFWGKISWLTECANYKADILPTWCIFKRKLKEGSVQRIVSPNEIIVQNLFKKEANRHLYVGKHIQLSTGESGVIDRTFGQTSKVFVVFAESLDKVTLNKLSSEQAREVQVFLKCKKYIFNKHKGIFQ